MTKKLRRGSLYRRGSVWWLKFNVDGKRIAQSLETESRSEAERKQAELMRPIVAAEKVDVLATITRRLDDAKTEQAAIDDEQNPPLAVATAFDAYTKSTNRPDSGESTLRQYEAEYRRFTRWLADNHKAAIAMRDVTLEMAESYASNLSGAGASASTFNQHLGFLKLLWKTLRREARTTCNPWEEIKRRSLNAPGRRELTVDELRRVCQSAQGELRQLFALGLYSGLRLGDCATLRWGEVDLSRGRIARIPAKTSRRNPKPVLIPIHYVLKSMLEEIPRPERAEYVLPETAAEYVRAPYDLVKRVQEHFESNGIRTSRKTEGRIRAAVEVGFHSLRHSFVSLCREANAPLAVVEAIVGHASPAMTRHYTHVGELAAASAVACLPSILVNAPAALPAREPLPAWAREIVERLTARNGLQIKRELMAMCG